MTESNDKFTTYNHNQLPVSTEDDLKRIWGESSNFKIFISHRDSEKAEVSIIQDELKKMYISSFVAHRDIEPTEDWKKEILRALQSMDILLTYLKDDFFNSIWTNQEIGFALGKDIPIIPLKFNINPEGFISILQAEKHEISGINIKIIQLILKASSIHKKTKSKLIDNIILSLRYSDSYPETSKIAKAFDYIPFISETQERDIVEIFNNNKQVNECSNLPHHKDKYFCEKLNLLTKKQYKITTIDGKKAMQTI